MKKLYFIQSGFSAGSISESNFFERIFSLVLGLMVCVSGSVLGQTTFSWRNDQSPANNASWISTAPFYFWNGSAGAVPGGSEVLFFDGSAGTTMTNNLTSTNRFKITFGAGGAARTIAGTTANTFFEFGTTWPRIQNDATNILHTLSFPINASTNAGFNLELVANAGSLAFGGAMNSNGRVIQVYGNNSAVDGTNRFVRLTGVLSGAGTLNVSQFGVVKLNGVHTYTGQTQIDNGELWLENANGIPAASGLFVGNGGQLSNVAKLWIPSATGAVTCAKVITINNGNASTRFLGGLNTSGTNTFSGAITNNSTTGGLNLTALNAGGTTAFSGIISGAGSLVKDGAGTVLISGTAANTFTGSTTVSSGTLALGKTANLIALGATTIENGATLLINAAANTNQWGAGTVPLLTINGNGIFNLNGAAQKIAIASPSSTSSIVLGAAALNVDNTGTDTYSGTISGTGALTKTNTGTLILGNSAYTHTGATTVTGGELRLNPAANASYASSIVLNGGTLGTTGITASRTFTSSSTLGLTASSVISLASGVSHSLTFANSSAVAWTATTTLTINGWSGSFNGTAGTGGRIFIGNSAAGLTARQLGQIFFTNGSASHSAVLLPTGELVASPNVVIRWTDAAASTAWYTNTNWTPNTASGAWTTSNIARFDNTGAASTAGINIGTAPLSIGAIQVSGLRTRALTIGNSSATAGNLTLNGASIGGDNVIVSNSSASPLTITNNETGTGKIMGLALVNPNNTVSITNTGGVTIGSNISGSASGITKDGPGTLTLSGVNTFGGNTTINTGSLTCGAVGALPSTTNVILANTLGAVLTVGTFNQTINSLSGGGLSGGNVSITTPATLTINGTSSTSFSGAFGGTGNIQKSGTSVLTLNGVNHTHTGNTTISGGELRINPSANAAYGSQLILDGGTLSTTGITAGRTFTSTSTLNISGVNSTIELSSASHTLSFANSSAVAWGAGSITINGWTGTGGASGTGAKIFFGNASGTLTSAQLSKITFTGFTGTPVVLSTGELVPAPPPVTYVWNGSSDNAWTTAANWTPAAVPTSSDYVTIGGGTNTLSVSSAITVTNLTITGNFAVASTGSLTVTGDFSYTSGNPTFDCASSLNIISGNSQSIPALNYGGLNISGGPRILASSGTIRVCGSFTPSSSMTVTGSTLDFNGNIAITLPTSTYNNVSFSGSAGTWGLAAAATLTVNGDLSISNGTLTLGSAAAAGTVSVAGNFSISGGNLVMASGTTAIGTFNLSGNFNQTGGTISRSATSTTSSFNFVKASGLQTISQIGGTITLTGMSMNMGNGSTTNNTVQLTSNLVIGGTPGTNPAGFLRVQALATLDFQTNDISGTAGFSTVANSNLITASTEPTGAFNTPTGPGSVQVTGTRTFNATTNYVFNGSSNQYIGSNITPTSSPAYNFPAAIGNLTINTIGSARVILNMGYLIVSGSNRPQSITLGTQAAPGILKLINGVLLLESGYVYVYNEVQGSPFGPSNMIVTNQGSVFPQRNPGQFRRYFPAATSGTEQNVTTLIPLGDVTGVAEYTPVIANLRYQAKSGQTIPLPYLGFKCIDARNPYDASLTDYMTRYWMVTTGTSFTSITTDSAVLTIKCKYGNSDVVGNEAALKMNRFSTETLQNSEDISSYTDPANDTLYSARLRYVPSITSLEHMFYDHDLFARKTVPLYYRSNASGKWQDVNSWLISSDLNFASPAGIVPPLPPNSANSDSIAILSAHTLVADTVFPPYTMDQALIEGTLQVASGSTMAFANGPGSLDVNVTGTLSVAGTPAQYPGSTMRFGSSAVYLHATPISTSRIPTATWDVGSLCKVTGVTTTIFDVTSLNQAFSDFTWDCAAQTASVSLSGNLSNVGRDLKILNTGGLNLGLVAGTGSLTLNVGRNLEIAGGNLILTTGTISPVLNLSGDLLISSGSLDLNSGSGVSAFNLSGNFVQSGGVLKRTSGTNSLNFIKASGTQTITQSAGSITGALNMNFGDGTSTNTVQLTTGLVNGTGTISPKSGATLDFQTNVISGTGTFSAAAGTTLKTANTDAAGAFVTGATAAGSVQTSTRIFSVAGVNYHFNGASAQTAGTGFGAGAVNNVEIDNPSGLSLSANVTINGTTSFTNGLIDQGAFDVTLGAAASFANQGSGRYFKTSGSGKFKQTVAATARDFPVGNSAYNPIQLTNAGASDVFGVQVLDATGSPAANDPTKIINRYWLLTENVSGGSNLTITTQYNAGEEAANFNAASNPVMGLYTSTAPLWKYQTASTSGSGPVSYTASFTSFTGASYHIGMGKDDAFNCTTPPAISSFSPSSAYAGETITLTGTGLNGLTSASIGGTSAIIATQSGTSATVTVQEGSTGTIFLTTTPGCGDFSSTSFTFLGYKSAQTGNWGTTSTWLGNFLPVSGKPVLIAAGHNVSSDVAATPSTITVDAGATLTLTNSANLGDASLAVTVNGTLVCPSTVTNPANGIQAATLTVANGAVFTNSAGNSDAVAVTTFNVNAGGTYNHDAISSSTNANTFDFPGATNNLNAAGNINITKWGQSGSAPTAPFPTPASGTYGNLTIDITTQSYTGAWNLQGGIPATANFTINGTGGREMRLFANSNTGTLSVNGNLIVSGGTVALISSSSSNTGSGTMNISGNMTVSGGSFNFTGTGSPTSGNATVNLSGDLSVSGTGTILRTTANSGAGVSTFRFNKASGVQNFTASSSTALSTHALLWEVGNGSTNPILNLNSNLVINSAASFTTKTGATLRCGTYAVSGTSAGSTGTFVLQSGATLEMGSADGITASPAASGNIQTNTRTFNAGAAYVYNGSVNQLTGNGLPSSITGSLSIANAGSAGNNTVTLSTNNTTVSTFNLSAGLFAAGSSQNLNLANAGVLNATGGDFATGATAGTLTATGSAVFNGSSNPYNVYASGGVNFGAQTVTIQSGGTFRINAGGFVNTNAPFYGSGSTLEYNTSGNYDRGLEWSSASGRGAPHHVTVTSTTLVPAKTGAAYAGTVFRTAGDLNIASGGNIYMDFGGNNMSVPLTIAGNLNLTGNLSASNAVGGDVNVAGNWTNNGSGSNFFPNGRQVEFNGTSAQSIGGSNATVPAFEYLSINNTSADVSTSKNLTVNQRLQMNSGKLILGNNNLSLGNSAIIDLGGPSSYVVTNGTGTVSQYVSGGTDWYPLGPSTSVFGPITLNQSGTADNISVRVSTAPSFTNAVNDNSKMVNLEWTVNESTAGGNNLATTFGWTASSEAASFDRSAGVFHGNHNGTRYVVRASNANTGSDPYFSLSTLAQPYTGNLSSQKFVVGNIAGILPCLQTSAAGNWNSSSNWLNGIVPPASSNVCIAHAMTISSAVDNPAGLTFETGGSLSISNGNTLSLESPGTITNSSGSFLNMSSGSIAFSGLGIVNGAHAIGFNNLELNGNTTLSTTPTINGILEIKPGGFILSTTGPDYGASSTLKYNSGGTYNRSNEWNASSGSGFPANVQVSGNTTLNISSGAAGIRSVSGGITVDAGSSLTQGSSNQGFVVPGNFTLNGTYSMSSSVGGDLVVGGNWSSGASAVLNHNNRDIRFNGTGSQSISVANGLQFGFLTIDNSGSGVDLLNTITVNTFRVNAGRTFNLSADKVILSSGGNLLINGTFNANDGTIEYTNGGNFTNNGTFNRGTSTIDFVGSSAGVVTGTVQTNFHNIRLFPGGGIDFGSGAIRGRVSGTLQLRAGSYVANNSPTYEAGSKLMYSGGGTFGRNVEWDPSTVQKVEITNNTTLRCGTNGTSFNHTMADSLIIGSGSGLDMTGPNMTSPVVVGGHILNNGTITLSGAIGGDLEVSGDFVNNGTFNANDRAITFKGAAYAGIKGSSNTIFHYLTVDKNAGKSLTANVPFSIASLGSGSVMRVAGGTFDLNNQAITFLPGSHKLRIDAGFAKSQTLKTGGSSLTGFSSFSSNASNSDTLGGKLNYSGSGSETLVSPVKGYNLLWITGGSTKSISQNVLVNDSLLISSGSTLSFGAGSSVLEVRGHVVNNGTVSGSGSGKVEMKNTIARSLTGTGTIRNLDVNDAAGISVSGKPVISNSLSLTSGKIFTGADTLILGSAATIAETYSSESYLLGNLKTDRIVNTNAESFGGMGVELSAGANLGTVMVCRTSGDDGLLTGLPLSPDSSIRWNWTITPSQQPAIANRSLTLRWPSSEDNNRNPSAMQIWKRSTTLDPWEEAGGIQTAGGTSVLRSVVWNNVNAFSQFTVGENNIPLSLDLLAFTAVKEKNHARISWKVADDSKASYYQLEKSSDNGQQYSVIETRPAGSADGIYTAFDYRFYNDSYYRIRVINTDGKEDVSRSVFLKADGGNSYVLYPNPLSAGEGVQISSLTGVSEKDMQEVRVFNVEGKLLIQLNGVLSELNQELKLQTAKLPKGVYQLRLQNPSAVETLRFIKN